MKYLSLASGIEAATVAWEPLGFEPLAFSQYDPDHNYSKGQDFASEVLSHHYPNITNHGDMTQFKEWPDYEPDIIVGGTPCQAFSIAGLRKGMDDPRGNLTLTYLAIIKRYQPRWFLWENVPGVLSSNGGRDFGSFLAGIQKLGYGFAYRVLDAQYFGVPQRRRRVFVVGHISDHRRVAAVLFDSKSLSGNTKKSRKTRQDFTQTAGTLTANAGGLNRPAGNANELDFCVVEGQQTANTLTTSTGNKQDITRDNYILHSMALHENQRSDLTLSDITPTMQTTGGKPGQGYQAIIQPIPIHDKATRHAGQTGKGSGNGLGIGKQGDPSPTLTTGDKHAAAHCFKVRGGCEGGGKGCLGQDEQAFTLSTHQDQHLYQPHMAVRRLMPIECERLQGFPDNYTQIPWKGKPADQCPDGPRYKACGNSMAVPVMRWIGERIAAVDEIKGA